MIEVREDLIEADSKVLPRKAPDAGYLESKGVSHITEGVSMFAPADSQPVLPQFSNAKEETKRPVAKTSKRNPRQQRIFELTEQKLGLETSIDSLKVKIEHLQEKKAKLKEKYGEVKLQDDVQEITQAVKKAAKKAASKFQTDMEIIKKLQKQNP